MHKYSNVEVISLGAQQANNSKGTTTNLVIKKEDTQKQYSLLVQDGWLFDCLWYNEIIRHIFLF